MAEAMLNDPAIGRGHFRAYSAGSRPRGAVHPLALELLREHGIAVDEVRSKSWDEFDASGAPRIDLVITVCDAAAAEPCPVWPGHPTTAQWSVPDPAAVEGGEVDRRRAFREAMRLLRSHIEELVAGHLDRGQSVD